MTELIPSRWPNSALGKLRIAIISNPMSAWLRIRDGWAVWEDGGMEDAWQSWNLKWRAQFLQDKYKKKS